jgi:antitoxin VapB
MATAKLFKTGRSQAVRLPKEFRFEGEEVRIRRVGRGVLLEPMKSDLRAMFAAIDAVDGEAFPERPPQPPMPDEDFDLD